MSDPLKMAKKELWYKPGLRFKCTECGACCTGAPGYVWISEKEIKAVAHHQEKESS